MITTFDIAGLYAQAFGISRGKPFDGSQIIAARPATVEGYEYDGTVEAEGAEFVTVRDSLRTNLPTGRPVFMPVRIGGYVLPNEPSIEISSRKNIVETALVGTTRRGTVKELINIEDWLVRIRGVAINYDSPFIYPEDQVKALNDLYNRNESLEIMCALTRLIGVYRLVIREFTMPEMIGVQHAQAYEFVCVSDEDFLLEIL
jgi:Domain of unknown function (DUF6046)